MQRDKGMQARAFAADKAEEVAMVVQALSVLVVDSASSGQQPILKALSQRGFLCETADSTDEATARLDGGSFDALIIYERAVADQLDGLVVAAREKYPRMAIIVVQSEYDGRQECKLFDLGIDDIVTLDYSPPLLATRTVLRTKNRSEIMLP
jgi:DNA-binding response OmpR family regulator